VLATGGVEADRASHLQLEGVHASPARAVGGDSEAPGESRVVKAKRIVGAKVGNENVDDVIGVPEGRAEAGAEVEIAEGVGSAVNIEKEALVALAANPLPDFAVIESPVRGRGSPTIC
jgi:hypothetical protein